MERRRTLVLVGTSLTVGAAGCLGFLSDDGRSTGNNNGSDDNSKDDDVKTNGDSDPDSDMDREGDEPPFVGSVEALGNGGFIQINEQDETAARDEGMVLPSATASDRVKILGEVDEDGTWKSTTVELPQVATEGQTVDIDIPEGIDGSINAEEERMTAQATIVATITSFDEEVSFDIDATTGESGELTGSAEFDEQQATVTLVENEFVVEGTGNILVDRALGLPSDEPGRNWLELNLRFQTA